MIADLNVQVVEAKKIEEDLRRQLKDKEQNC